MKKKISLFLILMFVFGSSAFLLAAGEENVTKGLSTTAKGSIQDSKTIDKYNFALNKEIIRLYKTLEGYYKIYNLFQPKFEAKDGMCVEVKKDYQDMTPEEKKNDEYFRRIKRIPQQTILRWIRERDTEGWKGGKGGCGVVAIEIENYGFVYPREKRGWGEPIGSNYRKLRLFFKNNKLIKIKSTIGMRDFKNHTDKSFYISHDNLVMEYKDDKSADAFIGKIHFKYINTHKVGYEKLINEMSNVISNPNQVLFKKEFYVKHLTHFENLYRKTMDYQKDLLEDLDKNLIKEMAKTLEY